MHASGHASMSSTSTTYLSSSITMISMKAGSLDIVGQLARTGPAEREVVGPFQEEMILVPLQAVPEWLFAPLGSLAAHAAVQRARHGQHRQRDLSPRSFGQALLSCALRRD